jgi:hypothetical protein
MTNSEKEFARTILAQQQLGWDYLEAERLANLAGMVTKDILPALQSSFAYSRTLPPRLESGFTKFYEALGRGGNPC